MKTIEEKVKDITEQISEQNALVEKDLQEVLNPVENKDEVNHPSHYTEGGIECIEAIRASMTEEAFKGYLKGCAQKYLWRYEKKANPKQDIEKAIWYLTRLKDELKMTYEEMEEELDNIMLRRCDVDVTELDSYRYDSNPYGLEYPLNVGSGETVYDEDEYDKAVLLKWIDTFESDTCYSWSDIDVEQDEDFTRRYKEHLKKKYKDLYGASSGN